MIGTKESTNMENITLKQLLKSSDLEEVYKILHQKHIDPYGLKADDLEDNSFESIRASYSDVCFRLLTLKEEVVDDRMSIFVEQQMDYLDKSEFIAVSINIEDRKMSLTEVGWSTILTLPIKTDEITQLLPDEEILAEILFELTFWGFSEEEISSFFNSVEQYNIYEV